MELDDLPFDTGLIITAFGKKRSGKSKLALSLFRSYPGDRVVIDVTGDDGPWGPGVKELHGTVNDGELPEKWPEIARIDDHPMTLRYCPDAGSETAAEDMDRIVGMAMKKGDCCILIHEIGVVARVQNVQPNMRRLLMHNRHQNVSAIFCGPRSKNIDSLVLGQSDLMFIFELQMQQDRDRIAENIGWDKGTFTEGVNALHSHEYLLFDALQEKPQEGEVDRRLLHCDALPAKYVEQVTRWAEGGVERPK